MKTIKIIQRKVTVNHKYGPSSLRYMIGMIRVCSVKYAHGNYRVNCDALNINKLFGSERDAAQYCENELMPHFIKMLQHGIQ